MTCFSLYEPPWFRMIPNLYQSISTPLGFHGTSHQYVTERVAAMMERDIKELKIVSCHLGNGASIAAVSGGQSVDTSMGFTPLEGLMMGTRSGDIDPGAIFYLMKTYDLSLHEVDSLLNKHSGLYGIAGASDMRDIEKGISEDDRLSKLAFDMYEYRIRNTSELILPPWVESMQLSSLQALVKTRQLYVQRSART